jgi:SNF2 family DNA or RNA helicase
MKMDKEYKEFLQKKTQINTNSGFKPLFIPDYLFDFQKHLAEWSIKKGRGAIYADCGLGKSVLELVWSQNVVEKTNGNVLLLTPLAVTSQMQREAEKFGIEAKKSREGKINNKIVITNYEQLHFYNPNDFAGVVCDESSILKNFDGKIKHQINIFMRKIKYRLLATATAAPNDYIELGTSSEALGYLGYMDMLNKFFKNDMNNSSVGRYRGETIKWRLKGHAEQHFWRWITSWARATRYPSDLGFDDIDFILPELIEKEHELNITRPSIKGTLLSLPAIGLKEQREERRATINDRCEEAAEIANNTDDYIVTWCNLNDEGDLLEKLITDSIQVSGRDKDEAKEEKLLAFSNGEVKKLIIKPKIGAWGLNWQHCNQIVVFPTYSYEQFYQLTRRCWRFGQKRNVTAHLVFTKGDKNMLNGLRRKQKQASVMFDNLIKEMNYSMNINNIEKFENKMEVPNWL